jgi:hypothetical protein
MILRRLGGGDEAYYTYAEEADNDANKNSALIYNWYKISIDNPHPPFYTSFRKMQFLIKSQSK